MSNLIYNIKIREEQVDKDYDVIKIFETDLPHHDIIKKWLADEWNKINPIQYSTPDIKDNILSANMKIVKNANKETIAQVIIIPKTGYRWSMNRRCKIWDELDGQISDGFGECFDRHAIPGFDNFILSL